MKLKVSKLLNVGVTPEMDRLESGRIRLLNNLSLLSVGICAVLIPVTIIEGLVVQPIFVSVALVLFMINIGLSWYGNHEVARLYFIFIGSAIVCAISINAYSQGLYTDTENILYGIMAVVMLLFGGFQKHLAYWILFAFLMGLKYLKVVSMANTPELGFWLTLQNSLVVGIILYLFLNAFFNILSKSLKDVVKKENTLYSLIDNVPIFMALEDSDRRYLMVNKRYEEVFGKPRKEIIGAKSKDILPDYMWDNHKKNLDKAFNGEVVEFLEKARLPDDTRVYASGKFIPIKDENGVVQHVSIYVDDIMPLKAAERKLKEELKEKDKLFSIIAHDIRSPLNLFEGLLNASDNQVITQEEFLVFKDKLRERFISLQETINGLLEWSRLQLDRIQPAPVEFNPDTVVDELISVFKPIAESKEIRIGQNGKADKVTMDINHYRIIFRNLLHNALKFTPNGGEIAVNYECTDEFVQVSVSDTGVGMSAEAIEKVMTKADVASTTGTMGETGTGLGLHLSLELLEKNGGQMSIHRNEDTGTTFRVRISC